MSPAFLASYATCGLIMAAFEFSRENFRLSRTALDLARKREDGRGFHPAIVMIAAVLVALFIAAVWPIAPLIRNR